MLLEVQQVKKAKKDRKLQKGLQMIFLVQMVNTKRLLISSNSVVKVYLKTNYISWFNTGTTLRLCHTLANTFGEPCPPELSGFF